MKAFTIQVDLLAISAETKLLKQLILMKEVPCKITSIVEDEQRKTPVVN